MSFYERFHYTFFIFWQLVVIYRIIFAFQPCYQSSEKFTSEPPDITTYEGGWANFTCSIRNHPPDVYTFFWNVDPDNEGAQEHLYYNEQSGLMSTTLAIKATDRTDYFIECNVQDLRSHRQTEECFSTRRATLAVRYFPKRSELRCSPNKSNEFTKGDIVDLKCSVTRSNPAVNLDWNLGDLSVTLPQVAKDVGRIRYLSYTINVTKEMHLKTIICEVTSRFAFPGKTLTCLIGPLNVFQSPRVTVYSTYPILKDGHVNISCDADGYPDVFEFMWTCLPHHLLSGCNTTNQNATLSSYPNLETFEQKYVSVACTAFNAVGNGTGSYNLTIERHPRYDNAYGVKPAYSLNTSADGLCENEVFLNITAYMHKNNIDYTTEVNVMCLISEGSSEVHWFLDEIIINSTNEKFVLKQFWRSSYSLTIINPSHEDNGKEVACKVTSCNITQTASLLLSLDLVDIDEMPSSVSSKLPLSRAPTSRTPQSNRLLVWHMVIIGSAGVVVTVIITAFLVTIIFMCVYRRSEIVTSGINATTDHNGQIVDLPSLSSNCPSSSDSTYEIPNVPAVPNNTPFNTRSVTDTISHYHHYSMEYTYAPEEANESGLSLSSQSSWTSDSDTYYIEPGYEMSIKGSRKKDPNEK